MNSRYVVMSVLLAATSAAVHGQANLPPDPIRPVFGLVGVARGQSAHLTVFWGDPHVSPPDPCHVTAAFVDATGAPLLDARGTPVMGDGSVRPGGVFALNMRGSDVLAGRLRGSFRALVDGVVESSDPETPPDPCHGLVPTLEIYDDASLRTESLYAPASEVPPPIGETDPPDPDRPVTFGLVGLAEGQVARLVAAYDPSARPPGPPIRSADADTAPTCQVKLAFVDAAGQPLVNVQGQPLAIQRTVVVGHAIALDARALDVLPRGMRRKAIHAVVRAESQPGPPNLPPDPCFGLVPTLELIDGTSGRTSVLYVPAPRFTDPPEPDVPE